MSEDHKELDGIYVGRLVFPLRGLPLAAPQYIVGDNDSPRAWKALRLTNMLLVSNIDES